MYYLYAYIFGSYLFGMYYIDEMMFKGLNSGYSSIIDDLLNEGGVTSKKGRQKAFDFVKKGMVLFSPIISPVYALSVIWDFLKK